MKILWESINNPEEYVVTTLAKEADDIPIEKVKQAPWIVEDITIEDLSIDKEMVKAHDNDPLHAKRRDDFITSINTGRKIKPLIVLGKSLYMVDGYARYRAIKKLGIKTVTGTPYIKTSFYEN